MSASGYVILYDLLARLEEGPNGFFGASTNKMDKTAALISCSHMGHQALTGRPYGNEYLPN